MNLSSLAQAQPAPKEQLPLPTGPYAALRGGRRDRTDEDREWHSEQVKVQIQNVHYREVWRQMVFLASCNPGRLCYAAHATIARKAGTDEKALSTKTVQRAVRFLQSEGLIECLSVGACRVPGKYLVLGRVHVDSKSMSRGLKVHQLEEGIKNKEKALSLNDTAQTRDPSKSKGVEPVLFPSPSQEQEKASAPITAKTRAVQAKVPISFAVPQVIAKWFKLMRKLGRYCDDIMAAQIDKLPHREKTRIINDLEARESDLAHEGKVEPAPIQKPKGFQSAASFEAQRVAGCQHVPADDLPINCGKCGAYIGKECADG